MTPIRSSTFAFAVAIAFLYSWLGSPGDAAADRKTLTTAAGCNQEFKSNKGAKKQCSACVKSNGQYKKLLKNKGAWTCEGGSGDGGGGASEEDKMAHLTSSAARNNKGDPWPAPLKAMPPQQKQYVTIAPGTFLIGAPRPADGSSGRPSEIGSMTTITRPFLMKTTEVTEAEWFFVMKKMPIRYKAGCLDCPVTYVSWEDTIAYLNALSKLEKLEACYVVGPTPAPTRNNASPTAPITWKGLDCTGYRLPTEAEWEYAGRGGSKESAYGPIDDIAQPEDNVVNGISTGWKKMPVGGKRPNAYGLYDMLGNVAELTWDLHQVDAFEKPQTDPVIGGLQMTDMYADRTIRGSSRTNIEYRDGGIDSNMGAQTVGFRPVRTVKK
ncbi:MAG: formylglycine-generating enzyme family protein [Kofleriaceae bacterium]